MKKIVVKVMSLIMIMTVTFGIAACSPEKIEVDPDHKYPEKLKVSMISRDLYKEGGEEIGRDSIVQYFEEKFNVEFEFLYQPSPSQDEVFSKIGNQIATHASKPQNIYAIMPARTDLAVARDQYDGLVENEFIVNSKEFVAEDSERYPVLHNLLNLPEVNTPEFQASSGALSMIPRRFGTIDHGFIFRKDWLDTYNNGKTPTDYKELESYLRAVQAAKPGGLTQVGLTLPSTWWFSHIYSGFSGANMWAIKDGKYQYALAIEEHKDGLAWLNKMFKDKLLDNDVFSNTNENDALTDFIAGRSAVTVMGVTFGAPKIQKQMHTNFPDLEFEYAVIRGERAPMRQFGSPYFEGAVVNKYFKDIPRLYDMIEFILSEEGEFLLTNGIEGIHYTLDADGNVVPNREKRKEENWERGRHPIANMFNVETVLDETFAKDYQKIQAFLDSLEEEGATVKNPLIGVKTKAEDNKNPWDAVSEWNLGFVKGTKSLDNSWSEYLGVLRDGGLGAIEKEINERFSPR